MNGFETITRLGGYLLLFSLISALLVHFWPFSEGSCILLTGILELSTGLQNLCDSDFSDPVKYLLTLTLASFGGICVAMQTKSCLHPLLSFKPYLTAKVIQSILTFLILLFFIHLI